MITAIMLINYLLLLFINTHNYLFITYHIRHPVDWFRTTVGTVLYEWFNMKDGILLIGYGTRKGNLEEILKAQAARLKASTCYEIGIAFFRVSSPTIQQAMEEMVAKGVERIAAVPYYVAEGTLTNELIPAKLGLQPHERFGEALVSGRRVQIFVARPFNYSPAVTDIVCDRIMSAGGTRDSGILVLGHGTRDPGMMNRSVVERNARRLEERGYKHVAFAFNEFCGPTIKDSIAELVSQGVDEMVCVPLFVAMGLHLGEEIPEQIGIPPYSEGGAISVDGKTIKVSYTRPLEDDPRLADVVKRRSMEYLYS